MNFRAEGLDFGMVSPSNQPHDTASDASNAPSSVTVAPGPAQLPKKRRKRRWLWRILLALLILLGGIGAVAYREIMRSEYQSRYFSRLAAELTFKLEPGPSDRVRFPKAGPFDQRLGYSLLPRLIERTLARGFRLTEQALLSPKHAELVDRGLYPIYHEKNQAGLTIYDAHGGEIFTSQYPQLIYEAFDSIPPVIVKTLLFIENRELLDERYPLKNPTVEWDRLGLAVTDMIIAKFLPGHDVPGGSTLATQIEKYRHSPEGRTASATEKLIQMASATLRAYMDGPETAGARRRIVTDYVNSVPLGAVPGGGEVRGIGHGLVAWHGAAFDKVNELLRDVEHLDALTDAEIAAKALAYKEVLSLFLSQRRPAYYLQSNRAALKDLTKRHMGALEKAGIISPRFRQAVEAQDLTFKNDQIIFQPERQNFLERKAANAVRVHLLQLFGFDRLYSLDRLDLSVVSTIDFATQRAVTDVLKKLKKREYAEKNGLLAERLLAHGDPAEVVYSFTLREKVGDANHLRVQADNVDGPFNVNEGGKLELGSTAKLRTIVTYLEVIEALFNAYAALPPEALRKVETHPNDHLSKWALEYLQAPGNAARGPEAMLTAALDRSYSASADETFFTGGGQHHFSNFMREDNGRTVPVREALKRSINLPFVRIMRDVSSHFIGRIPGSRTMLESFDDPARREYLTRFANKEGRAFLGRFYLKYRGLPADKIVSTLLERTRPTVRRLAAVFTAMEPDGDAARFAAFLKAHGTAGGAAPSEEVMSAALEDMKKDSYSLQDRGYVAGVHPLELWLAGYLARDPTAGFAKIVEASAAERQAAYSWLFASKSKEKQDRRIKIMLEEEAFQAIHAKWQALGYPFATLVPTYATALGSSGDKPAALADLVGIIQNGGVRLTNARVLAMRFGEGTPFETRLAAADRPGRPVLSAAVAKAVREALKSVVDDGTAVRLRGVFTDASGEPLAVGGKTGTGDNRYSIFAPGGKVIESKAVSRTATFVFYIGDRFFGTLTAFVPNAAAVNFNFTSALPVQILKTLAPTLTPLIKGQPFVGPPAED